MKAIYTIQDNEEIIKKIHYDLSYIVNQVKNNFKNIQSIILVGGFGRGEGSVLIENGKPKPLNDYDLLIIGENINVKSLNKLSKKLANDLQIDYVDLSSIHRSKLKKLPPTIFNYDMKYGSRVIYGDKSVLDEIPSYKPKDIPLWEGIRLLFNRIAGLLGGLSIEYFSRKLSIMERRYLVNQINHLVIAWIDMLNLTRSKYSHFYREKLKIFRELYYSELKGIFDDNLFRYAEKAIKFKLIPSYDIWNEDIFRELFSVIDITKEVYVYGMECLLNRHFNDLLDIPQEFLKNGKYAVSFLRNIHYLLKLYKQKMLHWKILKCINYPINYFVYISLPYILFSIESEAKINSRTLQKAENILMNIIKLDSPQSQKEKWEYLRKIVFELWNVLCH